MPEAKLLIMKTLNRLKLGTKFMLIVGLVVALVISSIFVWTYKEKEKHIIHEVETQAKIAFEQIVIARRWNADYGGVYVEKREGVESNPYLYEVGVNPDITDVEGKKYTLKNPAIMTRELSSYAEKRRVFQFHITSLKLINPNNAPDDFERRALEEFENGKKSVSQLTVKDNAPVFQYMAPLYVEEACLKCHGHQGYKVGDVRGGISVFLPIHDAYFAIQKTKKDLFLSLLVILLVMEATLFYLTRNIVVMPLEKLTNGAEEITRGNLDYCLDIKSGDELGMLASSFNTMAKELRKARDTLETRVKERTAELMMSNEQLQQDNTERKKAEESLKERTHDLGERVKELNGLYGISSLVERPGIILEEILQGTADLIPTSWRYPEVTCVRIIYKGQEFVTGNFKETLWKQSADIISSREKAGSVEVYYLEEKPEIDEGPFLKEERKLIDAIAERLGRIIERKQAEEEIRKAKEGLEKRVRERTAELSKTNEQLQQEVIERKCTEEALRESEKKYSTLVEKGNDGIVIIQDGLLKFANPKMAEITGFSIEEAVGKSFIDFVSPEDRERVMDRYKKRVSGEEVPHRYEVEILSKDGRKIPVEISVSIIEYKVRPADMAIIRDITERKKAETEMKRHLMKYRLDGGSLYLVKEPVPIVSMEALKDLLNVGYPGLVISRTPDEHFKKTVEGNVEFLWISERGGEKTMPPDLREIELRIENLPRKTAVLIDRLDYLVFKTGFEKTLSFVQRLRELVYFARHVIIFSIDPSTFSKREVRLLEKEAAEVMPMHKVRLPEDLLETLRFVYEQNTHGVKPYYLDVGREFGISKPTVGKRIRRLVSAGYLIVVDMGNRKILEITEKGRNLFLE